MEIQEVIRLADWFENEFEDFFSAYFSLADVLQHNAQQSSSEPVTEPLDKLVDVLNDMNTEQLSALQYRVLDQLEVGNLIGRHGAQWIEGVIKTNTYDPATASESAQRAANLIQNAQDRLQTFKAASHEMGIKRDKATAEEDKFLVNVIFQDKAAIENVSDWKKMASDWDKITRGLSAAVGEKPEEITVVSASSGSIIMTLATTAAVTKLLAIITKHITGIAHDVISIRIKAQELHQMKIMTKNMNAEFKRAEVAKRKNGMEQIVSAVKAALPNIASEDREKLKKSITKILEFSEDGGEVDFVAPDSGDDDEKNKNAITKDVEEIRKLVEDHQRIKQEVKLLERREDD